MSRSDTPVTSFAKDGDARIVHVSEVPRGLKCNCRCLHCDERMVARKGQIKRHHFAHHGPYCGGGMTWLHRTAQEILARERRILLPDNRYGFGGGRRLLDDIRLEAQVGDRRVDCLATTNSQSELAIEVRVRHEVDQAKVSDLKEFGIDVVELDLRSLTDLLPDWETLTRAVCDSAEHVTWLHNESARLKELEIFERYADHLRDLIDRNNIGAYSEEYGVSAAKCWKCGGVTPVFEWPSGGLPGHQVSPEPRPRTVVWSESRTAGTSYWGNRCAACDALQGAFMLFDNVYEYLQDWFEENGEGVDQHDLSIYTQSGLFLRADALA